MSDFIRIGRLIINTDHVCAVAKSQAGDETVIFVTGKGPRDTGHFVVSGPDAEKAWQYFTGDKVTVLSEG